MNAIQRRFFALSTWLFLSASTFSTGVASAEDAAIDALKRQVTEMQAQMQQLLERIEQLEREKAAEAANTGQVEQAGPMPTFVASQTQAQPGTAKSVSSAFNPAISVNGLFLGGYSSSPRVTMELTGLDFHNGFNFQEAEFQFSADVDPYWRANFILGVNRAGEAELEEGYVTSEQLPYDLLPRNTGLKLGKFFVGFGKHNLLHAHQFPFIDPPLVSQSVFGEEGLREPGLGLSYLLPTDWFSELTFQGLAGGERSPFPLRGRGQAAGRLSWPLEKFLRRQ